MTNNDLPAKEKVHSYLPSDAEKYGVISAVLLFNIRYWVNKNTESKTNFHDGHYWTFNSIESYTRQFPEFTYKQIRTALNRLVTEKVIWTGEFNQRKYDYTKWYTINDGTECPTGQMVCMKRANGKKARKGQMVQSERANGLTKRANGPPEKGKPIPDIIPDIKPSLDSENKDEAETSLLNSAVGKESGGTITGCSNLSATDSKGSRQESLNIIQPEPKCDVVLHEGTAPGTVSNSEDMTAVFDKLFTMAAEKPKELLNPEVDPLDITADFIRECLHAWGEITARNCPDKADGIYITEAGYRNYSTLMRTLIPKLKKILFDDTNTIRRIENNVDNKSFIVRWKMFIDFLTYKPENGPFVFWTLAQNPFLPVLSNHLDECSAIWLGEQMDIMEFKNS